jgi:hypothetical protein
MVTYSMRMVWTLRLLTSTVSRLALSLALLVLKVLRATPVLPWNTSAIFSSLLLLNNKLMLIMLARLRLRLLVKLLMDQLPQPQITSFMVVVLSFFLTFTSMLVVSSSHTSSG